MRLRVASALVDGALVGGDVEIDDGVITSVGRLESSGEGIAVPGFVDIHINGFAGVDFLTADVEDYRHAAGELALTGVTAFQPTFTTAPEAQLVGALERLAVSATDPDLIGRVLGAHLEGPFLSPRHPGVHPPEHLQAPDLDLARRLLDAGPVTMVTLAPELPGALELIELLVARGVVVSCGHTDATVAQAARAFAAGASTVTHVFNAMRPVTHRDPGIAVAALTRDDVVPQLILDHDHLAPETARLAWRASGGRLCVVTDAIAAAGAGDGTYRLGACGEIEVTGGKARRADGRIAGSTATLAKSLRNLVGLGASPAEAMTAVTATPARVLRRGDVGHLRPGVPADVVVLGEGLHVERVFVAGRELTSARSAGAR